MIAFLLLGFLASALASGRDGYNFRGKYKGRCSADGIYFMDARSFVLCSGKNAYQQPCAPGTKNSDYSYYTEGGLYAANDFCNINLVDVGYNGGEHYHYYRKESSAPSYKYEQQTYEKRDYKDSTPGYGPPTPPPPRRYHGYEEPSYGGTSYDDYQPRPYRRGGYGRYGTYGERTRYGGGYYKREEYYG